ncbi:hypothetical protein [Corynebacterium epidermidicanis]|uniref:Uncharacterized protein n=1 Tax=Corynebacterium epidermidicanis TaxID=1050174 RepID=A0A0G3GXB1_9CORY|nr:hypothetical protein [Corynebacterium epidermidicanis]AKK04143.1 hypothetical protein CEPID_11575 [Corynebacterium epidermidicanis]
MEKWWENCIGLVAAVGDLGDGGLLFEADGQQFEIPAGGNEMHTEYGAHAMTVYADLDGDGVVDQVSTLEYGGSYQVFQRQDGGENLESPANRGWGELSDITQERGGGDANISAPDKGGSAPGAVIGAGGWACVEWG